MLGFGRRRQTEAAVSRSRRSWFGRVASLFGGGRLDDDLWDQLEELLISADVGVPTTETLLERLKERVRNEGVTDPGDALELLKEEMVAILSARPPFDPLAAGDETPLVVMLVGVNGAGKTTAIAKLAQSCADRGKSVLLGAADTFRAAAVEQLQTWGGRLGVDVIAHRMGADPGAVAFDTLQAARARGVDVAIIDTAGRLHTKSNLMEEIRKMHRVLAQRGGADVRILLVLDATVGQNGLIQARAFTEALPCGGVFLAKLDGTSRGGIVLAICRDLGLPVLYVGSGEQPEDVAPFDPGDFVEGPVRPTGRRQPDNRGVSVPMAILMGNVIDKATGEPVEARVQVLASTGAFVHPADAILKVGPGDPFFYSDGGFAVEVPRGPTLVVAERGTEYAPARVTLEAPSRGAFEVDIELERWSELGEMGWHPGNTHLHYDEKETRPDERLLLDSRIEDLRMTAVSILKRWDLEYASNKYAPGVLTEFCSTDYYIQCGEENRHNVGGWGNGYGHVMLLGIRNVVEPVSRGALVDAFDPDYPPLSYACDDAREQGGLVIWCHNGRGMEAPVAAALGKLDAFNLFDPWWSDDEYDVYYRMLNAGAKLPASTRDRLVHMLGQPGLRRHRRPLRVRGVDGLPEAGPELHHQRAGPLPLGPGPGTGETVQAAPGQRLSVRAAWTSHYPSGGWRSSPTARWPPAASSTTARRRGRWRPRSTSHPTAGSRPGSPATPGTASPSPSSPTPAPSTSGPAPWAPTSARQPPGSATPIDGSMEWVRAKGKFLQRQPAPPRSRPLPPGPRRLPSDAVVRKQMSNGGKQMDDGNNAQDEGQSKSSKGSGLYVDVENLSSVGQTVIQNLVENWPDKAPAPSA